MRNLKIIFFYRLNKSSEMESDEARFAFSNEPQNHKNKIYGEENFDAVESIIKVIAEYFEESSQYYENVSKAQGGERDPQFLLYGFFGAG